MDKIELIESNKSNKNNKNNNFNKKLGFALVILIAFALGVGLMYWYSMENPTVVTKNRTISETKVTEEAMEDAIKKIYDSVLCIEVLNQDGSVLSTGTGFVYGKDDKYGYVLTNAHVVSGATNIQGMLSNNSTTTLTLLGSDTYTDLAVLRMDIKDVLQVASIGDSKNTAIGNTVFTVGSPMGATYAGTVTKGILSGKDRLIETSASSNGLTSESYIVKVLQTDAAISPGNSGGPLVNLAGDVIGITSLKLVDEQVEGMGFAIPIEDAMNYVDSLEKGKAIQRPVVGVQILDLTNKYALYRYGINVDSSVKSGVILVKVNTGYPASNGGLKEGDIVTKIDGNDITTVSEFKYELYKHNIGDTIEVTYYRDGKENKTTLKLDKTS
ncbi:MAG: S1C family serine protease [Candidatus Aphodocola sp.]